MATLRTLAANVIMVALAGCSAVAFDISPDYSNNSREPAPGSYAGLTVALAGNLQTLYAVSMNAGIWRSSNGAAWAQLQTSPPEAEVIAVDPNDGAHVLIGERAGRAKPENLNQSGVWESADSGNTWNYVFNPLTASCNTQAIAAVVIDNIANEFVATSCGVFSKAPNSTSFSLMSGINAPTGQITGLATASSGHPKPWVWARTKTDLYLYKEDTNAWEQIAIPGTINSTAVTIGARGDPFALAAYANKAMVVMSVANIIPATASCTSFTVQVTSVVTYDDTLPSNQQWTVDQLGTGDGTKLGGRRFVRAYETSQGAELFVGGGQNLYWGESKNASTTWKEVAETPWGPIPPCASYDMNPISQIHTDMWDAHLGSGSLSYWISGDGGIYRSTLSDASSAANKASPPYSQQNEGLHTHHIHKMSIIAAASTVTDQQNQEVRLMYPTSDNDTWVRDIASIGNGSWLYLGGQGDTNTTFSDVGGATHALSYRNPQDVTFYRYASSSDLCSNNQNSNTPLCSGGNFPLQVNTPPNQADDLNYEYANVIQTVTTSPANAPESLDVLMLATQNDAAKGPITALIRSDTFSLNADASQTGLTHPAWTTLDSALPISTGSRVWSTGGHNRPTIYMYSGGGSPALWRRAENDKWSEITGEIGSSFIANYHGSEGPVFVDPYVVGRTFILTASSVRAGSGDVFSDDAVLLALITGSGTFPISGDYPGAFDTIGYYKCETDHGDASGSRALSMGSISHMAFDRLNPNHFVASAPYTGVFYSNAGVWHDLTSLLPKPLPAISSVAITARAIYVATEGRGLFEIMNYNESPVASYFDFSVQQQLVKLLGADGLAQSGKNVNLEITNLDGSVVRKSVAVTDGKGTLSVPSISGSAGNSYIAHLNYAGGKGYAPASIHFKFSYSP